MIEPIEQGEGALAPEAAPLPPDTPAIIACRALAAPATVDRVARTVEVVWSTGARARNFVPPLGPILEELDMAPAAVRMDGLRSGRAPVLDAHRRGGARDVLGRVLAARIEAGRGYATLQFSTAADVEPVWQRVADGTLRAISVGYRVHRYDPRPDPATGQTVHHAVDWEPFEISVVPVPIDPAAAVRGDGPPGTPAIAVESPLPEEPAMPETSPALPAPDPTPSATPPQEPSVVQTPPEPTRAAPAAFPAAEPAADAIRIERARIAALGPVLATSRALVPATTGDALHQRAITEGWSAEALRGALWDAML